MIMSKNPPSEQYAAKAARNRRNRLERKLRAEFGARQSESPESESIETPEPEIPTAFTSSRW
jgi:hypothetical protein